MRSSPRTSSDGIDSPKCRRNFDIRFRRAVVGVGGCGTEGDKGLTTDEAVDAVLLRFSLSASGDVRRDREEKGIG